MKKFTDGGTLDDKSMETKLKQQQRREKLLPNTIKKMEQGKRLTKSDMAYEIGRFEVYHPACIYWDTLKREYILEAFNYLFGTDLK